MKLCSKCGTPCNDSNFRCVECGAILPAPLNEEQQRQAEEQISDYIDDRASKADAFARTKHTYVMTALDAAGLILSIVLLIVYQNQQDAQAFLYSAVIFLSCGISTYFPKADWWLSCLSVRRFFDASELTPSDYYLLTMLIMRTALPILAYFLLGALWIACSGTSSAVNIVGSSGITYAVSEYYSG